MSSTITTNEWVEKAKSVHGDTYDYSKVNYTTAKDKVIIICKEHGEFEQIPRKHISGCGCKKCGNAHANDYRKDLTRVKYDTKWFIDKAIEKHGIKYDYSKSFYKNSQSKVIIICPIHGEFEQSPREHLNKCGCQRCAYDEYHNINVRSADEFISLVKTLHNNFYDYSKINYINNAAKIDIICPKHGIFQQTPKHHLRGQGCTLCNVSSAHLRLHNIISKYAINIKNNDRTILAPQEVDIYLPDYNLGFEIHGVHWHSYYKKETPQEINRHQIKADAAINKQVKLIQFFETEIINKEKIVESMLNARFGKCYKINARDCIVGEVRSKDIMEFSTRTHMQGFRSASVNLVLKHYDNIVMHMSFSKCEGGYEIIRMSSELDTVVVGGASKLFKYFTTKYHNGKVITYADRRFSNGDVYKKLGFKLLRYTKPNYFYVKHGQVYSRQKFQKHRLAQVLEHYDPELSETDNMFNNKYRRLWDAGHCYLEYN